jgi:hypothetical protein
MVVKPPLSIQINRASSTVEVSWQCGRSKTKKLDLRAASHQELHDLVGVSSRDKPDLFSNLDESGLRWGFRVWGAVCMSGVEVSDRM